MKVPQRSWNPQRLPVPKKMTAERFRQIHQLKAENQKLSHREIGRIVGCSHSIVGKVLRGEQGISVGPDGTYLSHWKLRNNLSSNAGSKGEE